MNITQLLILDYCHSEVHLYWVDPDAEINADYVRGLGFNPDECSWMTGEEIKIYHHNKLLK